MTSGSILILLVILHLTIVVTADQVGSESEFDYLNNSGKGPASWGTLKHEYLEWVDGGNIYIKGKEYKLTNTHWHSPSEHTLNGNRYDLELHVVHADDEQPRNFAVIAILYKIGYSPDPFLAKLERNISTFVTVKSVKEIERGVLDPNDIGISGREFCRYQGSLTTPPCTETVTWTVEQQIKTVSADQVNLLREAVNDNSEMNARPLQQLNGRDVRLYADHLA